MALQVPYPAPAPGFDLALRRQDDTGKFDWIMSTSGANKGNPVFDQTRTHSVLSTLTSWKRGTRPQSKQAEGGYYWDATGQRGTLLWTATQDKQATRSDLIAYAEDGGTQLVNLNYISAFTVDATRRRAGAYTVYFTWITPSGEQSQTLNY